MTLFLKEFRSLRLWWGFIMLLHIVGLWIQGWDGFLDLIPFAATNDHENSGMAVFTLIAGVGASLAVFAHEREYGTQPFLDALPVGPGRVFCTKLFAALLVPCGGAIVGLIHDLSLGALALNSIRNTLPWQYGFVVLLLEWVLSFAAVGLGSFLSFTGRWFAAVLGLCVWLVLWLRLQSVSWGSLFDPMALLSPPVKDGRVETVLWLPLAGHLLTGTLGIALAATLYCGRNGETARRLTLWRQRTWSRWMIALAPIAAVLVWVLAIKAHKPKTSVPKSQEGHPSEETRGIPKVEGFERHQTKLCDFIYRTSQQQEAEALWKSADAICEEVLAVFGNQGRWPGRLMVDLSATIWEHAAGQTNWTKIKLPLEKGGAETTPHIFRHEIAHVVIEQLSDGKATTHFDAMRAFHEGMATFVELSNPNGNCSSKERADYRQVAAHAWHVEKLSLDQLLSSSGLESTRFGFLVYPVGLVFVEALIDLGGQETPTRMMQTLAKHPPKSGTKGKAVWQHLLSIDGYSWVQLEALYEARMQALAEEHRSFLEQLPRLTGSIQRKSGSVVIQMDAVKAPSGFTPCCLIQPHMGVLKEFEKLELDADGTFHLPANHVLEGRIRYMLGWKSEAARRLPFFDRWVDETVPVTH